MQGTVALCAGSIFAAILGQLTDPSTAPFPGATVRLLKEGSNMPVKAVTNTEGFYNFPFPELGVYTLTVTANVFVSLYVTRRSPLTAGSGTSAQ